MCQEQLEDAAVSIHQISNVPPHFGCRIQSDLLDRLVIKILTTKSGVKFEWRQNCKHIHYPLHLYSHLGRSNRRGQGIPPAEQVLQYIHHSQVTVSRMYHMLEWDMSQKPERILVAQEQTKVPSQTGNMKDLGTSLLSAYLKSRTNIIRIAAITQRNPAQVTIFSVKDLVLEVHTSCKYGAPYPLSVFVPREGASSSKEHSASILISCDVTQVEFSDVSAHFFGRDVFFALCSGALCQ